MLARRYAPFVVVVLAQLVVVGVAPSVSPKAQQQDAPLALDGGSSAAGLTPGGGTAPSATGPTGPAATTPGSTTAAGTPGAPGTTSSTGIVVPPGGVAAGDTSHCVGGYQFGPFPTPPRCVPRFAGNNGGATTRGVTAKEITVVFYRPKENDVVNGFTKSQNLYIDPAEEKAYIQAAETFINSKWELYGRKLRMVYVHGTCEYSPADNPCMRNEARSVVSSYKPFAVIWDTNSAVPAFPDELSRLHVVNIMGWHFDDSFSTKNRPYHWDVFMGGTAQARLTGEYWCKRLAGKKAKFAGDAALQQLVRKAGISYPDADVNVGPGKELAKILRGCGTEVLEVPYSSDVSTAASQAATNAAKMKSEGVTSVLCFCDPLAPTFASKAATSQDYHPENVLVGNGLIDYDILGRLYDPDQWKNAFGVSDLRDYKPFPQQAAAIAWRGGGGSGVPNPSTQLTWDYMNMLANGLQMAGPQLTPLTWERALLSGSADTGGDPKNVFEFWSHFGPGDYSGLSDAREVYWDANATSAIDGKKGAYVSLLGHRRFREGAWPRGEPALPGR
ncbi:MAG: hypothetical protein QOI82_2929 [Actinomycetota bacterium]|nr:hypothetical protein [Actinomycetota bacterium]